MSRTKIVTQRTRWITLIFLWCLLFVLFINEFGIFTPTMPVPGLDGSWQYSLNQAVAQKLIFGKDIIFTLGPYSSVYTHNYHPATVWMMTVGILLLDVVYLASFAWLAKDADLRWPPIVAWILLTPVCSQDAFLLSIPLLLILVLFKLHIVDNGAALSKRLAQVLIVLAFACLGLLPLIKGTILLLTAAICVASAILLLINRRRILALLCLLSSVVSMVVLWAASGQRLVDMPGYFFSMRLIIAGYSEAMASDGPLWQLLAFILGAAIVLLMIATKKSLAAGHRGILLFVYALFFFVAFKEGFVRQDGHVWIAMNCLAIGALFLPLLNIDTSLSLNSRGLLTVALLATAFVLHWAVGWWGHSFFVEARIVDPALRSSQDMPRLELFEHLRKDVGARKVASMIVSTVPPLLPSWDFEFASWHTQFDQRLRDINVNSKLNFAMAGTVDIYSFEQSSLLATGDRWDPRPAFQSYTAYTPELIRLNELHLRVAGAPDHLVFTMEPLDSRLPSLEDGLSWPAMLDNYAVAGVTNDWVHLVKRSGPIKPVSRYKLLGKVAAQLGEMISVPPANGPVFVEVDERPSALGSLSNAIYKSPSLILSVTTRDGTTSEFEVIANMMKTGFILSPLVTTNQDFVGLFNPDTARNDSEKVQKVALSVSGNQTAFWNKTYMITFKQYEF